MYTQEQINQMVTDVMANLGDQGRISEILQDFRTDYTGTLTDIEKLNVANTNLLNLNQSLKDTNNKMLSQLGDLSFIRKEKEEKQKAEEEQKAEEGKEPYTELFGKDGELI